jgi:hypothetical protein
VSSNTRNIKEKITNQTPKINIFRRLFKFVRFGPEISKKNHKHQKMYSNALIRKMAKIAYALNAHNEPLLRDCLLQCDQTVLKMIEHDKLSLPETADLVSLQKTIAKYTKLELVVSRSYPFPPVFWAKGKLYLVINGERRYLNDRPKLTNGVIAVSDDGYYDTESLDKIPFESVHWKHDGLFLVDYNMRCYENGVSYDSEERRFRGVMIGIRDTYKMDIRMGCFLYIDTFRIDVNAIDDSHLTVRIVSYGTEWWFYCNANHERSSGLFIEFSGREMIWWDYTDDTEARRMTCRLFPYEHKQVENLQIPTELELFVLEFLAPYF